MSLFGAEPTQLEAVVLTHEHTDHTRGVRRFCEEFGMPVFATRGTLSLITLDGVETRTISAGRRFSVGFLIVDPFKVRHLAAEPVAFSISVDSIKLGIASDLGSVTPDVVKHMSDSSLMFIEANYDEEMLLNGDYPDFLKRAIKSDHGHLSNNDAALLSVEASSEKTERVVLVHLSRDNNTPEKARETVRDRAKKSAYRPTVDVVEHSASAGPFELR